jgi:hypothetical protein
LIKTPRIGNYLNFATKSIATSNHFKIKTGKHKLQSNKTKELLF